MTKRELLKILVCSDDLDDELSVMIRRSVKSTCREKIVSVIWVGDPVRGILSVDTDHIKQAEEGGQGHWTNVWAQNRELRRQ